MVFFYKQKELNILKSIEFTYFLGCFFSLTIPWHITVSPSISNSYYYGFSNRAGLIILFFTIVICFFRLHKNNNLNHFNAIKFCLNIENKEVKLKSKFFYFVAGLIFVLFLFLLNRTGEILSFGEAPYFIQRLYLMQDGLKPYNNFEFAYGAFLLYFPFCLVKIFNLSVPIAYQISLFFESLFGYYALWNLCGEIANPKLKNKVFFLLFVPSFFPLFMGGANYTLFRFVVPLALSCKFYKYIHKESSILKITFCFLCNFIIVFIISPEIAITSTLTLLSYFVFYRLFSLKSILICFPTAIILGILFIFFDLLKNSIITLYIFSQGGNNFPWFFSPTIIFFFFIIYFSIFIVSKNLKSKKLNNSLMIVFTISVLNLPGSMGRCDGFHLFFYGFGFFLITLSNILCAKSKKLRLILVGFYIILYFVFLNIGLVYFFKGYGIAYIKSIIKNHKLPAEVHKEIITNENSDYNDCNKFDSIIFKFKSKPLVLISIPTFFENSNYREKIDFPYFIDGTNKFSIYSNEILVKEILDHDVIIISQNKNKPFYFRSEPKIVIFFLFGLPHFVSGENNPNIINEKIYLAIKSNFIIDTSSCSKNFLIYKRL